MINLPSELKFSYKVLLKIYYDWSFYYFYKNFYVNCKKILKKFVRVEKIILHDSMKIVEVFDVSEFESIVKNWAKPIFWRSTFHFYTKFRRKVVLS